MRRWMLTLIACAAGCLHPQAPSRPYAPEVRAQFTRLVNDPVSVGQAAEYAKIHGLPSEALRGPAMDAWKTYMKVGIFDAAGEVAWRFKLGPWQIGTALDFARKDAKRRLAEFLELRYEDGDEARQLKTEWALGKEAKIACVYGPAPESAKLAVADVIFYREETGNEKPLYDLLDHGCPVGPELRDEIIDLAAADGRDAWAIRHAGKADWTDEKKTDFVSGYFQHEDCADGFLAIETLRPPPAEVVKVLESKPLCESKLLLDGRKLPREDASKYFFAAIRSDDFHLAHELMPSAGLGEDGTAYLLQELVRDGWEFQISSFLALHPKLEDRAMEAALVADKVRQVGHLTTKPAFVRRAFDRAIALGRHLDALLIAENGCDEPLKLEAPKLVFDAAMKGGDYEVARFTADRYPALIPKEERDKAQAGWIELRKKERALAPPKKRKPRCDDWTVTNRDKCE